MIKRKSNKKGFTIMEMLIVVAIIAVLAAIAIPTFNGALTKSKEAADVANIRAAYAEVTIGFLTGEATTFPNDANSAEALITAKTGTLKGKGTLSATVTSNPNKIVYKYVATKLTGGNDTSDTSGKTFVWTFTDPTVD